MPKRTSLPSMLPPGCKSVAAFCTPSLAEIRIARLFRRIADEDTRQKQKAHRRKKRPSLPGVLYHLPKGVNQPGGDQKDEQSFEEVGKRRRIFKRMRGIGVEEASAICAQLLDGNLRRRRPLRNRLGLAFKRGCSRIGVEVLNHTL